MKSEIETSLAVVAFSILVVTIFWLLGKQKQNSGPLGTDRAVFRIQGIILSFSVLPFLLVFRHEIFLKILYGLAVFAFCEVIWRAIANRDAIAIKIRHSLSTTLFLVTMLGVGIVVVSWYLVVIEIYIELCGWIEKEILGR